jgi:hypothetical protein
MAKSLYEERPDSLASLVKHLVKLEMGKYCGVHGGASCDPAFGLNLFLRVKKELGTRFFVD